MYGDFNSNIMLLVNYALLQLNLSSYFVDIFEGI